MPAPSLAAGTDSGSALIVIDVQRGFDDRVWGRRNNPHCEPNIAALIAAWRARRWPLVFVRHDSRLIGSPLAPGTAGNAFKPVVDGRPDLLVAKQTNSAFYGTPDLHAWLATRQISAVAICGITTNHCCETTARMAGNLGYDTTFILDATHTFDRQDLEGRWVSAEALMRTTATNLNGEFATVRDTRQVLSTVSATPAEDPSRSTASRPVVRSRSSTPGPGGRDEDRSSP